MHVPFLDLRAQNEPLRNEILAAINDVIDKSSFAGGPFVNAFEQDFAAFCGAKHAIGLGSGTEAIWLVLLALGIGPGDEVITVPSTFMATAEAITYAGATPVFVDIEDRTYTMDARQLAAAITPRTKAIIPVHLFGQMADMDPIMESRDNAACMSLRTHARPMERNTKAEMRELSASQAASASIPGKTWV